VPGCEASYCCRKRRKECALRKYFIKEYLERKKRYFGVFYAIMHYGYYLGVSETDIYYLEYLKKEAYFWRGNGI
jgi:hypothetical protein